MDTKNLPDFITVGAMKAGTSTLHFALDRHPGIFIPSSEIGFFDIDEIDEHGDFFIYDDNEWSTPDYDRNFDEYLDWYDNFFSDATSDQLIGEDSTSYLSSRKAPERIADLLPDVKIIILLRDPVERLHSHYWHLVNTGRATMTLEEMLRHQPHSLIRRSSYKQHLERYEEYFPDSQVKVVLFEDFVERMSESLREICDFLGLDAEPVDEVDELAKNRTTIPRNPSLKRLVNRWFKNKPLTYYRDHLPYGPDSGELFISKIVRKSLDILSSVPRTSKQPMNQETEGFLRDYFRRELRGINDLVEPDLKTFWTWIEG